MSGAFVLHPDLAGATHRLGAWDLCEVLLMKDARFVWLVLSPRHPDAREIEDLPPDLRAALQDEYLRAGRLVRTMGEALGRPVEKLNIAALGNVTPQLHVHVIGRRSDDEAWPRPVWGVGEARPWEEADLARLEAIFAQESR